MKGAKAAFKTSILLLFIMMSFSLAQEDKKEIFQMSLEELGNVVVTPSKFSQSINNVTQKIDVITSAEIETSVTGNRNISEIIEQLPGASVTVLSRNDANWGTYGGIGPNYSTYMLNGLPLDAFVDPMSIDVNAIDHIEVQRGPASVFYPNYLSQDFAGNQSPLAGTINLILKQKIDKPKTMFKSALGSYNTLAGQIYHQDRIGKFNYFCGTSFERSDYTNYGTDGSWLNMKKNPEYKKTQFYAGTTLFMDDAENQKFTIFLQKTWHNGDKGRVYQGFDFQYATINAGYDLTINESYSLQSHIGIRSYDRSWQNSNFGIVDTFKSLNGVYQLIIPSDISFTWNQGNGNLLSIGADYQNAEYYTWTDANNGYNVFGNKSAALQTGVYTQQEINLANDIFLRGGIRYSFVKNMIDLVNGIAPDQNKDSWEKMLWSLGVRYAVNDIISLYANAGSSFSTPGLKASAGTISMADLGKPGHDGQLPNPNLKAENGTGLDSGIDVEFYPGSKIGFRFFLSIIQDAIVDNVVNQNPSQTISLNAGSSRSTGGEIEFTQRINQEISWYVNGTYMSTNIKNDFNQNQNNAEIPFAPKFVLNMGLNYSSLSGFIFAPSLNYNDGFYDGIDKTNRSYFKPGIVVNVYIAKKFSINDFYTIEGFVQLYNITNNDYEMPWQFKNPGFSGMAGIKIIF